MKESDKQLLNKFGLDLDNISNEELNQKLDVITEHLDSALSDQVNRNAKLKQEINYLEQESYE